jgi:transketolase
MALAAARLENSPYQVWVLCGDSELAEGSMWEAFEHAGYERLDNLTAIIDVNRLGQRGETRHGWDTAAYARRIGAFGWHTIEIDGHDIKAIDGAYTEALGTHRKPTAILARTMKGRGVAAVQDAEGAHGKPVPDTDEAIAELGGIRNIRVPARPPSGVPGQHPAASGNGSQLVLPEYERGEQVATRTAVGAALAAVGAARPDVVVLDGEVSDSTRTEEFARHYPDRFFEFFIAEQQMAAAALGMQVHGWVPFAATFAAFWARAYDVIRMAAISRANLKLIGSHAGVSIGQDGPSQMGLEDLAMMRAVHDSVVLYPCDANQAAALTATLAGHHGIGYLRATRGGTPVIYRPGEQFPIGGSKVLRSSDTDQVTIIAAGITVHHALSAADALAADGIPSRVIDLYSVKPVDAQALRVAAEATGAFVTVEDHWAEGGLGDAVLAAFANGHRAPRITKLAVHPMPGSASPDEQLHAAGIDAKAIEAAARALVANWVPL